jgi:DNA polymerase III subunit delta'
MPLVTFDDIQGQDKPIAWLRRAYESDRLPHGLVFAGPAGVGKGTTARALATVFLCHRPNGTNACGKCESCRVLSAELPTHPDFTVVYRQLIRLRQDKKESVAKDLSVHTIREHLLDRASLTPAMNYGRAFVVEEAETMNAAAQNSLLKTLEEPHGRTLIVLLTSQPGALLPTIRSRTQLVRFGALDRTLVAKELAKRGIEKATAQQAAELSEGSLGTALKWIEDGVIPQAQQLLRQLDELLAGRPPQDLADWFKNAADAYAKKQVERDENTSLDQAKREGLSLYLRLAGQKFRNVLKDPANPCQLDQACAAIEAIAQADDYLDANVNIPIIFQQLAVALTRLTAA